MTAGARIETSATPEDLAVAVASRFVQAARAAVEARGTFRVALSGGSTPKNMLAQLATPRFAPTVPWPQVRIFWSDERCVPPDDADSNYRMVAAALLSHIAIPAANVVRMRGELEPAAGAADYRERLQAEFGDPMPSFDLLFLGLGPDGHTASLFPRTPALDERVLSCVATRVDAPVASPWRLTLTLPAINESRAIAFLVEGVEKAGILAHVLRGERDVRALPAQGVAPRSGSLTWYVDAAAASKLT